MSTEYSNDTTNDFFKACKNKDLKGILAGLDDKTVNIEAFDSKGYSALTAIVMSAARSQESTADILAKVLEHDRVKNNPKMFKSPGGRRKYDIEGLFAGKYKNNGLYPPSAEFDKIQQLLSGKTTQVAEPVVKKTPPAQLLPPVQSLPSGAKNVGFFKKHSRKIAFTLIGLVGSSILFDKFMNVEKDNTTQSIEEIQQKNMLNNKVAQMIESGEIVVDYDNKDGKGMTFEQNPDNMFIDMNQPVPTAVDVNEGPIEFLFDGVHDEAMAAFDNMKKNPMYNGALNLVNAHGDVNIVIYDGDVPEYKTTEYKQDQAAMYKHFIPGNDNIIHLQDTTFFKGDADHFEYVQYETVAQTMAKEFMYGTQEMIDAAAERALTPAKIEKMGFAYGQAHGLLYLYEQGDLLAALHNDKFDDMKYVIDHLQQKHEKFVEAKLIENRDAINALKNDDEKRAAIREIQNMKMSSKEFFMDAFVEFQSVDDDYKKLHPAFNAIMENDIPPRVETGDRLIADNNEAQQTGGEKTSADLLKYASPSVQENLSLFTDNDIDKMFNMMQYRTTVEYSASGNNSTKALVQENVNNLNSDDAPADTKFKAVDEKTGEKTLKQIAKSKLKRLHDIRYGNDTGEVKAEQPKQKAPSTQKGSTKTQTPEKRLPILDLYSR